jgi:TctA family transporter
MFNIVNMEFARAIFDASRGNFGDIFTRPLAMIFLSVSLVCLFWPFIKMGLRKALPPRRTA